MVLWKHHPKIISVTPSYLEPCILSEICLFQANNTNTYFSTNNCFSKQQVSNKSITNVNYHQLAPELSVGGILDDTKVLLISLEFTLLSLSLWIPLLPG